MQLNSQQERLFLFEQKRIKGGAFSIPILISFEQKLSSELLIESLGILAKRHENLNTIFVQGDSKAEIRNHINPLNVHLKEVGSIEEAYSFIQEDAKKSFDLFKGPLYRFYIYETQKQTFLYFNFHHLIWDGTSTSIFISELNKVYTALKANQEPKLKKLNPDRFTNYIKKHNEYLQSEVPSILEKAKEFYKPLNVLELPIDYHRPKELAHQGDMVEFELDQHKLQKIQDYCAHLNLTQYSFFSACFSLLLYRYSKQVGFYQGTPLLGRFSREDMSSLGFYVHTGLIPCLIDSETTVHNFLKAHHERIQQTQQFSRLPLSDLVDLVDPEYDLSRTAGFQTFYMYQDFSNKRLEFDGASYERKHLDSGIAQSDLDLWIAVYRDKVCGGFHFPLCLFKKTSVELMQLEFINIIDKVLADSELTIEKLPIADKHLTRIKEDFYFFTSEPTESLLFHFQKMAKQYPQKVAVKSAGKSYTYQQLDQLSARFSHYLSSLGNQKGDLVAVSMARTADLMIALLGVLKSDCCYLPIDSKFPKDRIQYMLEHSGTKKIVVDEKTQDAFSDIEKINLTNFLTESEKYDHGGVEFTSAGNQSAYIIYTSGSTGKPKGVEISIHAMTNFLLSMQKEPGIPESDSLCAVTTLSFDISVLELYLPLISGATVFIASSEEAKNSQLLANIIHDHNITMMQATPITWRLLFNSGWDGKNTLKVLCGGEKMPNDLSKELIRSCHSLWNMYGPTETTVWSTCKQLIDDNELITIGYPIRNTSILILDKNHQHVPIGAIGEIYIGGEGLAKGYLNREDLTDERFVTVDGERFYQTGDQGRFTSWQEIICLGRLDHQVKIRGHRIELGEIEFQLSQLAQINQSIVVIREDIPGDKRLVAYLTLHETITETKIKEAVLSKLPPYMLPEHFVFLEKMPLTPNGKIDQKNLPSPYAGREQVDDNLTLPQTKTEKKIAEIWKKELGIPNVYQEDNFFDIGGNSLVAASVFHKMSLAFKCNLELALLFEFPNLTLLSTEIDALMKGKKRTFSNIVTLNRGTNYKNLFFFHAIGGNTLNYRVFVEKAKDFNCYGVQSDGVDGLNIRLNSVETMAENYVRQILEVQPEGPYYLIGGSLGGLLAYEVARLLRNRRKEVKPVIMFDTAVPQRKRSKIDQKNRQEKKSFRTFGFDQLRRRILGALNIFYRIFHIPTPIVLRVPLLEFYNFLALKRYRPKDYDGDIYMIRIPIKEKGIYARKDLGWGDYVHGKIESDYIDAPHEEFIESSEVAKIFGDYIHHRLN